jgi:hypothetical protein
MLNIVSNKITANSPLHQNNTLHATIYTNLPKTFMPKALATRLLDIMHNISKPVIVQTVKVFLLQSSHPLLLDIALNKYNHKSTQSMTKAIKIATNITSHISTLNQNVSTRLINISINLARLRKQYCILILHSICCSEPHSFWGHVKCCLYLVWLWLLWFCNIWIWKIWLVTLSNDRYLCHRNPKALEHRGIVPPKQTQQKKKEIEQVGNLLVDIPSPNFECLQIWGWNIH